MREMDAEAYHFRHSEGCASTPWNPPIRGRAVRHRGRGRVIVSTVILAKRGSPKEGQGGTLLLLSRNQLGDSRAERENDSRF